MMTQNYNKSMRNYLHGIPLFKTMLVLCMLLFVEGSNKTRVRKPNEFQLYMKKNLPLGAWGEHTVTVTRGTKRGEKVLLTCKDFTGFRNIPLKNNIGGIGWKTPNWDNSSYTFQLKLKGWFMADRTVQLKLGARAFAAYCAKLRNRHARCDRYFIKPKVILNDACLGDFNRVEHDYRRYIMQDNTAAYNNYIRRALEHYSDSKKLKPGLREFLRLLKQMKDAANFDVCLYQTQRQTDTTKKALQVRIREKNNHNPISTKRRHMHYGEFLKRFLEKYTDGKDVGLFDCVIEEDKITDLSDKNIAASMPSVPRGIEEYNIEPEGCATSSMIMIHDKPEEVNARMGYVVKVPAYENNDYDNIMRRLKEKMEQFQANCNETCYGGNPKCKQCKKKYAFKRDGYCSKCEV